MPHIAIKGYPKNLSETELQNLSEAVCAVIREHLKTTDKSISIAYQEVEPEQWKAMVYDKEIKPVLDSLLKKPGYEM